MAKGRRRSMEHRAPVSRKYILGLLDKVDTIPYGPRYRTGMSPEIQRLRNKALISFLYLGARRVSEVVGREYPWRRHNDTSPLHPHSDKFDGVHLSDIRYDKLEGRSLMIVQCRILKKGSLKHGLLKKYGDVIIDMDDTPFSTHTEDWIKYQRSVGEDKLFHLSRTGVYLILQRIDSSIIGPHWFRHQRLSHLAENLSPYQLTERVGYWESIEPAVSYVHGRVKDYLEACEKAREE